MIHISCPDCGWAVFGKAVLRVDATQVDLTCPRCRCVIRMTAVKLHDGDPAVLTSLPEKRYTYDANHNQVALRDVRGQTRSK